MRPTSVTTGFAYVALVLLAACSGGGGGNPAPNPTVAPSTATPTATPTPTAAPTAMPSPVTITNSGSTNTQAYTIVLNANGTGTITKNDAKGTAPVGSASAGPNTTTPGTSTHASTFFTDLAANAPLSAVSTTNCTKDASFGTTTTLTWQGPGATAPSTSGDISCPVSSGASTLNTDVQAVDADFGVNE